jgi:myosin tail region-interacting protein MTI1
VAPPPSRNAYVPPPREPPTQKPYRREEDPSVHEAEPRDIPEAATTAPAPPEEGAEDQPKPQSLKERIALLQKQQLEQAARNAEKKEKPKKPPKKRIETESGEQAAPAPPPLTRLDSGDTVGRPSVELGDQEHEPAPPSRRTTGLGAPQPQPIRELVSDTNDADDSGAADDDDAQDASTEEERPRSKAADLPAPAPAPRKSFEEPKETEGEDDEDEEEEEEEEDPEIRRRRELRERMAKMSGGMGMMGMFGPPGGVPGPRKPKPSSEVPRQTAESHAQDEPSERAAPVQIMALPGMAQSLPKRHEQPQASQEDEDVTAKPTPQAAAEADDYISPQPLQRRSTDRAAPPVPQGLFARGQLEESHLMSTDRGAPPPPPRDTRAAPPPPPSGPRAAPPVPQSPTCT